MTDREKLIEIIGHTPCCGFSSRKACEHIADHLITNGVTIRTADKTSEVAYNLSPTETQWIPVTERLPGFEIERVLVMVKGNFILGYPKMDTDRYVNSRWVRYGDNVTHWMQLPEPLKEGTPNGMG